MRYSSWVQSQKRQNDLCLFPGQIIQYQSNSNLFPPASNAEEAEIKWFYEDLQNFLLLSRFSHVRLCATPEMAAHQAPPSLGFSKQEHWSGLPFPSPMHESEN